ncbi:hypothetical protein GL218_04110 [Daldinia childiae]|uniref:uncharacterized protein n=1 Tax=Daldinia childiae TaxID=326645 RepID=UPI0014473AE9|nr:uncharacterized protein GL218_04110 [Daldinia childiae]KAF3061819.1 hypothetical protein GL218_04110 [Daldinia childiae]
MSNPADPATKPTEHNQVVANPLAHFKAIPWCAALLSDPAILDIGVPDRRPLPNGDSSLVRKTMNSPTTSRACVTFYRLVKPTKPKSSSSYPSFGGTGEVSPAGGSAPSDSNKSSRSGKGEDKEKKEKKSLSASEAILSGGGKENGENPRNPFVLFNALVDLGEDCQSFPGVMHGGMHGLLMDEVMGTAANAQTESDTLKQTTNKENCSKRRVYGSFYNPLSSRDSAPADPTDPWARGAERGSEDETLWLKVTGSGSPLNGSLARASYERETELVSGG